MVLLSFSRLLAQNVILVLQNETVLKTLWGFFGCLGWRSETAHREKSKARGEFVPLCFAISITFCFKIYKHFFEPEILHSVYRALICFTMNGGSDPTPVGAAPALQNWR